MEETRVKKFKDYRNSLSKREGEVYTSYTKHQISKKDVDEILESKKDNTPSISTLSISYEQIFEASQAQDTKDIIEVKRRRKYILKIVLIALGCTLLVAAIIVSAILIFGR